jgi:uncharacterized protein YndB with AHSA1/START domain
MSTKEPQLSLTRIVNAPRALVYEAFTDPVQFASWWGPIGNSIEGVEVDIRVGGFLRWTEVFPDKPNTWTHGRYDLTDVVAGELLDGILRITGELPGGYEPFETRMRIEFYDVDGEQTRLEIRQWLREDYVSPSQEGWAEAFSKLDASLAL